MAHKVICINRRHGSGGAIVGKMVAEELGIGYYNDQLLEMAIKYGDLDKSKFAKVFEESDEKAPNKMFYKLYTEGNEHVERESPAADIIYDLERQIITDLAKKEDFVVIGRCAGAFLKEEPDVDAISIFATATQEQRLKFILENSSFDEKEAAEQIEKVDHRRAKYFEYFAKKEWALPASYDVTVNIGNMGIEKAVKVICGMYNYL